MKLVVGLGNPGRRYARTRHNIGFEIIDSMAQQYAIRMKRSWRFPAHIGKTSLFGSDLWLVKPLTFMNRSGQAVGPMMKKLDLAVEDLVVIVDDLDLDCGQIRIRQKGGSGGHRGLKSIIEDIGSEKFIRLRVGIGPKPPREETVNFVLSIFDEDEEKVLAPAMERSGEAIQSIIEQGPVKAMNAFN